MSFQAGSAAFVPGMPFLDITWRGKQVEAQPSEMGPRASGAPGRILPLAPWPSHYDSARFIQLMPNQSRAVLTGGGPAIAALLERRDSIAVVADSPPWPDPFRGTGAVEAGRRRCGRWERVFALTPCFPQAEACRPWLGEVLAHGSAAFGAVGVCGKDTRRV